MSFLQDTVPGGRGEAVSTAVMSPQAATDGVMTEGVRPGEVLPCCGVPVSADGPQQKRRLGMAGSLIHKRAGGSARECACPWDFLAFLFLEGMK